MKKITLLSIIFLLIMAGCGSRPASTVSSLPALASEWNLVIDKDFKNLSEPWCDDVSYSFGRFYCQEGEFHIKNESAGNIATMTAGDFKNFKLEVLMRSLDNSGSYGVVFGVQDDAALYYLFRIRPSGQFQLIKWSQAQPDLVLIPWTDSPAINKGLVSNQLDVVVVGTQIRISINNEQVAELMDTNFAHGSVGPVATEQGHAVINSMKVWELNYRDGDLIHNLM